MGEGDTIIEKLEFIRDEKLNKIIPENIKSGVNILNVDGALSPSEDLDAELTAQEQKLAELEAMVENKTGGVGGKLNIFVQLDEPSTKKGIWIESGDYEIEHIIADEDIFESESWNTTKMSSIKSIPYDFIGGSAVTIGTNIYLFSSKTAGYRLYTYKYDTVTDTYTKLTDIPYDFYQGSTVAVDTDIYLFGSGNYPYYNYKYDTLTDTYTQLTNIPYRFIDGLAVTIGTNIYLFGSSYSSYGQYAYKYDTVTNSYTRLTNVPTKCYRAAGVAIGTDVYLFSSYENTYYAYKYDTITDTYTKLTDPSYNFEYSSATAVDTTIYLFGRYGNHHYGYKYDIVTNTYTGATYIPYEFYQGSAVIIEDRAEVYLLGGSDNPTKVQIMELNSADYENNSFVISQGVARYSTEILGNNNNIKFWFNNAWVYVTEEGLVKGLPTYYGDGTQWIKFKN